jgi:hypothetical protein
MGVSAEQNELARKLVVKYMDRQASFFIIPTLMLLNGLFFSSNIYVVGNAKAALKMHDDLPPWAGPSLARLKVIVCFITGVSYVVAFFGAILARSELIRVGAAGASLFLGLYIVELALWGKSYPRVWRYFFIFGGVSAGFGLWCFSQS